MPFLVLMVSIFVGLAAGEPTAPAGFRGDGTGRYPEATPPIEWSPTKNVAWATTMPSWSNASPVLLNDLLITCSEPGSVVGLNAADGKIRWTFTDEPDRPLPKTQAANGYTSATPISDGSHIYTVFGSGRAIACDRNGKRIWAVNLEVPPNKVWGSCMSPRLAGGLLIVHIDQLWGLDPATGVVRWQTKTPWTWGTPVIARVGETDIVWTGGGAGFIASTGKLTASGLPKLEYNSPCLIDGMLYYIETIPVAFKLGTTPETKPQQVWQGSIAKDRYYGTPLVHEGLIYVVTRAGLLSVLDAKDGKTVYEQKLTGMKGTCYSSPTLGGANVFISCDNGVSIVMKPGRTYTELGRNTLESFRSSPVFAGNKVFIRGQKSMWCLSAP